MRKVSEETKIKEGRGTGHGADYKPWIKVNEINSNGVTCILIDWKHKRGVHLLSRGEKAAYLLLRWNKDVIDIREQFPLDIDETNRIADELGFNRPAQGRLHMTTDLLVDYADGTQRAISVKTSRTEFSENIRNRELAIIESIYWKRHGVEWSFVESDRFNKVKVSNIENVTAFWDISDVTSEIDYAKHLIARGKVTVDMDRTINYREVIEGLKKEGLWDFPAPGTLD